MVVEQSEPLTRTDSPPTDAITPTDGSGHKLPAARRTGRKFWITLHLYVGLCAGGLFVLSSLTGGLLVFYKTIDDWLNPEQILTRPVESWLPLEVIVTRAQATHPEFPPLENLTYPLHDRGPFQAWFRVPDATPGATHWQVITIDPSIGRIVSDRQWGRYVMSFLYELHKSLLLEETGETIVGVVACVLFISVGSGMYLWWPARGNLRRAFTFTSGSSVIRRHHDLHKLGGMSGALVLLILSITGFYLAFPGPVTSTVRLFSPVRDDQSEVEPRAIPHDAAHRLPVTEVVAIAQRALPEAKLMWIGFPSRPDAVYSVGLRQPGEVREAEGQSQVWIDPYSGAVLRVRDSRTFTVGETIVTWLFPLHSGEAFGLTGRWIVLLTGFVPSLLYVTALRMWWLKRRAHRRQRPASLSQDHDLSSLAYALVKSIRRPGPRQSK